MLLIYTHHLTPRVRYIFKHFFSRILLIDIDLTSSIETFTLYDGIKFSYTHTPIGEEFYVRNHELLFEQGISELQIVMSSWDGIPCFFPVGKKSAVPFDIFAASFYLLSRYEEYFPHVKDKHGRFSASQSLAFQHDFLEKPLIDIWAKHFLKILCQRFPSLVFKEKKYRFISTIDVDNAFAFKHKGFIRVVGGFFKDIWTLDLLNLIERIAVLFNIKKDPFNTFDQIITYKNTFDIKTIFFFLVSDYTTFDTGISTSKTKFRLLIKDMVDYARVGLHPSYYTMNDVELLKKEKERIEEISNMPIFRSRQHFLRFSIPNTYQKLIDLEISEDYSMGYASHTGFRASTCTPFYFYDIDFEIQTPLKVFPFALMDTTLNDYLKLTPKQSLGKIRDLKNEVKKVNGIFITLFHNETLSGYGRWRGWKTVYKSLLKIATS